MKRIQDLPKSQRPRERLASGGAQNLTDIELIALILGTGTKGEDVLKKSAKLIHRYPLAALQNIDVHELTAQIDVGPVGAGRIIACIELGKRMYRETSLPKLLTPQDVCLHVQDIRTKHQEYLLCFYLNARHELIEKQIAAIGSINQAVVEPRDIFSPAIKLPSSYIILVHNHPSGDPTPSNEDIQLTKRLEQAGSLLGIRIVDHIIVASARYTSFRELQLMNTKE